jgi:GNAT superfamily N-acetyltransferase
MSELVFPSVLELEEVAFKAWPAEQVVDEDGWRLRFTHGVTRRGNSVWPNALHGTKSLDERIAAVEVFAAARGIAPSFQITAAALPADLDAHLADRGYVVDAPVSVEVVTADGFRMAGQPPQITTSVTDRPSAAWLEIAVDRGRFAPIREPYLALLGRLDGRAGFATAKWKGKAVGVGLGVMDAGCFGIFNMSTLPESRRRRAATAVLGALVTWGASRGAAFAYLQVEKANDPATALYRASGFTPLYDYHYRIKSESH